MWKALSFIQKNLIWSIPVAIISGLFYGILFDAVWLKKLIIPVTFIMVYPMMVTINMKSVLKGHDAKLQITSQLFNFILIPILAYFIGSLFFSGGTERYALWAVGLFLIGVLPTSGMTISWTGFARGNKEAATKMVVLGMILGALAAPIYTRLFMGATIEVDMLHMFRQIAIFVFIPMFAGIATQYVFIRSFGESQWNKKIKPKFPPFSALGVILIAFVAMSLKAKSIVAHPGDIILILTPVILFYIIAYSILSLFGKLFLKKEDATAMVFGVVMRNLSIALAIAITAFGKQGATIALLISLAYIIQIQSAALYIKFIDTIFGRDEKTPLKAPGVIKTQDGLASGIENEPFPMVPDIKRILYASDLSETARYAVRYACSIGNKYNSHVTILHVVPDILEEFSAGTGINLVDHVGKKKWNEFNKNGIEAAKQIIKKRIKKTSELIMKEIPVCPISNGDIRIEVGNPLNKIVSVAEEENYDLVIIGTHGHGKLGNVMVGSIASGVIKKCTKPVLTVRLPV